MCVPEVWHNVHLKRFWVFLIWLDWPGLRCVTGMCPKGGLHGSQKTIIIIEQNPKQKKQWMQRPEKHCVCKDNDRCALSASNWQWSQTRLYLQHQPFHTLSSMTHPLRHPHTHTKPGEKQAFYSHDLNHGGLRQSIRKWPLGDRHSGVEVTITF